MLEIGNYILSDRDIIFDKKETHDKGIKRQKRVKRRKSLMMSYEKYSVKVVQVPRVLSTVRVNPCKRAIV